MTLDSLKSATSRLEWSQAQQIVTYAPGAAIAETACVQDAPSDQRVFGLAHSDYESWTCAYTRTCIRTHARSNTYAHTTIHICHALTSTCAHTRHYLHSSMCACHEDTMLCVIAEIRLITGTINPVISNLHPPAYPHRLFWDAKQNPMWKIKNTTHANNYEK